MWDEEKKAEHGWGSGDRTPSTTAWPHGTGQIPLLSSPLPELMTASGSDHAVTRSHP